MLLHSSVILDPSSDNWTRTIYVNDHRTESPVLPETRSKNSTDVIQLVKFRLIEGWW